MSKVRIQGGASGTGVVTLVSPTTSTNRTVTLPDETGTLLTTAAMGGSVQPYDAQLANIAGLAVTNGLFIVADGTDFVAESGATARASMGVAIGTDVQAYDATIVVDADIGTTVQAYDATILKNANIGTTVQAYDATIVVDADIGVNVQAYDATIMVDADIGTTVQAYDADTSKVDVAETRSASINMADNVLQRPVLKDYSETKVAMAASAVDLSLGNVFTKTISGATTLAFNNPPATGKAGAFTLILTNGGSATITWPTSVDWAAATAPVLTAAGVDVLTFTTIDGGLIWYGIASGIGMG